MWIKTMKQAALFPLLALLLFYFTAGTAFAGDEKRPKIAVTDLSYEERVAAYFLKYDLQDSTSSGSSSFNSNFQSNRSEHVETGLTLLIDRGELRKFTADIKGELIKSGHYRVVQGKPWINENTEALYDIINRIKEGYYPGADFVLFGSINNVDFRNESNPIQGSDAVNDSFSLELVAEFSLINTKTYEVAASFSATGEGKDSRLINSPGTRISPDRGKIFRDVSQSLGVEVAKQIEEQFPPETK